MVMVIVLPAPPHLPPGPLPATTMIESREEKCQLLLNFTDAYGLRLSQCIIITGLKVMPVNSGTESISIPARASPEDNPLPKLA